MLAPMGSEWKVLLCTLVGLAAGCVKPSEFTQCGDFTCGIGAICSPDGKSCVAPETVYACNGLADGDRCTYTGVPAGVCTAGICIAGGCGNGVVEAALGEICDDGNLASLDGCRGDCKSVEMCGDGIQDLAKNEYCDCGMPGSASTIPPCDGPNSDEAGAVCRTDCTLARCGDGVPDPGESCDDGNNVPGDGCRADCTGRWTAMTSNSLANLAAVWAASPTDAWAVGDDRIMRWNGTAWSRQADPDGVGHNYLSVCGISPTDVFVVGNTEVFRYQGTASSGTWTKVAAVAGYSWFKVFCRGTQAWIAGNYNGNYIGYGRWTGSGFSVGNVSTSTGLLDIWSSSDGVVYAVDSNHYVLKVSSDYVYWNNQAILANYITGTASNDITTASDFGVSHFGTDWTSIQNGDELAGATAITAVPGSSPPRTIVVGASGAAMFCTATTCIPTATATSSNLRGLWALDDKHIFIVGTNGTILY